MKLELSEIIIDEQIDLGSLELDAIKIQPTLIKKEITENGSYNASDDNVDGYNEIDVNVYVPNLQENVTKTYTENGSYLIIPDETYDGIKKANVTVDVFGVDVRDTTATKSDVKKGKTFYDSNGIKTVGNADLSWDMTYVTQVAFNKSDVVDAPEFDTSRLKELEFIECKNLKNVPNYNLESATSLASMFTNCTSLEEITLTNITNKTTSFYNVFGECTNLKRVTLSDTSGGTNTSYMFYNCPNLEYISELDLSSMTRSPSMFGTTIKKETFLGGFPNYGKSFSTTASANSIVFYLNDIPYLPRESSLNVINNLYDIAAKGCNTQKIRFNQLAKAKLTTDDIKIATDKGWTIE